MKMVVAIAALLLSACAHRMAEPIEIGQGVYMLTAKSTAGIFKSGSDVKVVLYRQASQWCGRSGRSFEEISSSSESGARMPSAELHFRCADQQ